jgi:hypothetical protein
VRVGRPATADDVAGATLTRCDNARGDGQPDNVAPTRGTPDVVAQWSTFRWRG